MYLNMDDHTEALDFVFTLLGWDRTTDFIIKKETIDKENHYLIDLNTNLFDDFLEAWIQKKPGYPNFLGGSNLGGNLGDNNEK